MSLSRMIFTNGSGYASSNLRFAEAWAIQVLLNHFQTTGMAELVVCLAICSNALMVLPMNKVDGYILKVLRGSRATGGITAMARTTCGATIIPSDQLTATSMAGERLNRSTISGQFIGADLRTLQ